MKKKVMKVMELCYDITENTEHDAFFDFSAHVGWVTVEIYKRGWKPDARPNYRKDIHMNLPLGNPDEELANIIRDLKCYLEV